MTTNTCPVLVLGGGPGGEHDVSVRSADGVATALADATVHEVPVEPHRITLPREHCNEALEQVRQTIEDERIEVVFPVLHGRWGEGGALQTILELFGIPYVGSDPAASALAMDKARLKAQLLEAGLPTPRYAVVGPDDPLRLQPPIVLKPVDDGSSVDLEICTTAEAVAEARERLHARRTRLLAEQFIAGRELTIGLIDGRPLPALEIVPAAPFYDYAAKYERDDTRYVFRPDIPGPIIEEAQRIAVDAWRLSGARDLARVDFMIDENGPWFLELNTMPGFTAQSLLPMAAERAGMPMPALCGALVESALARRGTCATAGTFKNEGPIGRS